MSAKRDTRKQLAWCKHIRERANMPPRLNCPSTAPRGGEGGAGRESTGLHEGAYTVGGRGQGGAHRDSDKRKRPACRFRCMCILRAGHRRHGKIHTALRSISERERVALSRTSTSAPWPSQLSLWILSIAALGSCCSHMPDSFWHWSSVHSTRLC